MKVLSNEEFLQWASQFNIVLDTRYESPQCLILEGAERIHCKLPLKVQDRISLITAVINVLPRGEIYLWKRGGEWYVDEDPARESRIYLRTGIYEMFRRIGIPMTSTTLLFARDEVELLTTVLLLNSMIAWKVPDELTVVHENGKSVLNFESEGSFHFGSADQRLLERMRDIIGVAK